jgi:hypothetical protein
MILIKNNIAYKFKGSRDEKTLKDFIFKNYSEFDSTKVPTELPTFMENVQETMVQTIAVIRHIYASENTMAKVILSFLFGVVFVLVLAVCYFSCCDSPAPSRLSKRTSHEGRLSSESQRNSVSREEARISSSGNDHAEPNIKKRSTARRRD